MAFSATVDNIWFGPDKLGLVRVAYQASSDVASKYISMDDDDFLGQFNSGEFTIEVGIRTDPSLPSIMIFSQDQDKGKTLHPIAWYNGPNDDRNNRKYFAKAVRLYEEKIGRRKVTKYPTNHVKCVYIHKEGSWTIFQLWEIAIVSQLMTGANRANFFLTTQMTAESEAFRDESGNVLLPDFEGYKYWESLQYYVKMLIDPCNLPPIASRPDDLAKETPQFEGYLGRVLWYNEAQQFGLVQFGKGLVARVHWSQIQSSTDHKKLSAGQMVKFVDVVQPTQTTARPTTVKWELRGVEAIA
jgi:cold shock CspA family protein